MSEPRTVFLTGASRGIGAAIRERLIRDGHTVLGIARDPGPAAERYRPIACDLSDLDGLDDRLRSVLSDHPGIDTVILNAGAPAFRHLEEFSSEQVRGSLELNLVSPMLVARAVLGHLKKQPRADLIILGSEAARRGAKRGSLYCAAKFGLRGFGQSLRQECASSPVRVTLIHPGLVRTGWFDELDFAPGDDPSNAIEPGDVAEAVALVLAARPGTVFEEIDIAPHKKVVRSREKRNRE